MDTQRPSNFTRKRRRKYHPFVVLIATNQKSHLPKKEGNMPKFSAKLDKVKKTFVVMDRSLLNQYAHDESGKDKEYIYEIEIKRQSQAKSREQENFRWGVVYPEVMMGLREVGYLDFRTKEDIHELLKSLFLKKTSLNDNGEILETTKTTSALSVEEEQKFQEDIRIWAYEYLGISISEPNKEKL